MNRLFDIVTLSDCNTCNRSYSNLGTIWDEGKSIVEGIIKIFSGGGDSGLPGDYDNRVRQAHAWAIQYGVVECVDHNKVAQLIIPPDPWQGRTESYMIQLQKQKQQTGSCQSVFQAPGGVYSGATLFPVGSQMPLLLLGAFGLFLVSQSKKRKRR